MDEPIWKVVATKHGYTQEIPLALSWEVNCSAMSDDYTPDEMSAGELWDSWLRQYPEPVKIIYWSVVDPVTWNGMHETAPFQPRFHEDFLTHFQWPTNLETGERLQWTRLTVVDMQWNEQQYDKGGFVQEATGWKPSPFQAEIDTRMLAKAAGLWHPASEGM